MTTQMSFHSATISTIFKDYNSPLMPQSSLFNVNITNKMPKFIGFMKLACRFGHSKEEMDLHASLEILAKSKMFIKVTRGLPALEVLNFLCSVLSFLCEGTTV